MADVFFTFLLWYLIIVFSIGFTVVVAAVSVMAVTDLGDALS